VRARAYAPSPCPQFNSWDRAPLLWDPTDPGRVYPARTRITRNFFVNNYHSTWPIDHDDGSNSYDDSFNFLAWGGAKQYLGFDKKFVGNFYLYPDANMPTAAAGAPLQAATGFSPFCYLANGVADFAAARQDSWVNETCIASSPGALYSTDSCDPSAPHAGRIPVLANNTLFLDTGAYELKCGDATWTLAEANALGVDVGTTVAQTPDSAAVLALAAAFVRAELMVSS
jgi:hypothetical protein